MYTLNVQLVFLTKYRRPGFADPMLTFSEHLMREVRACVSAQLR